MSKLIDNYGHEVPEDLEILPQELDFLSEGDIKSIVESAWWQVYIHEGNHKVVKVLVASTTELIANGAEFETDAVKDHGRPYVANRVENALKRFSLGDGFYTA